MNTILNEDTTRDNSISSRLQYSKLQAMSEALQKERKILYSYLGQEEQLNKLKPSLVADILVIEEAVRVFYCLSVNNPKLQMSLFAKVRSSFQHIYKIKAILDSQIYLPSNSHPIQSYFESEVFEEVFDDFIPQEIPFK